jgi:hypothetical protein
VYYSRKNEEAKTDKEETLKFLEQFFKNRQRLTKKSCKTFKELLKNLFELIKYSRRRKKH